MTTNNDARILAFLTAPSRIDFPPTAREIAEDLGINRSTVDSVLRRMEDQGKVEKLGVAMEGGRTWGRTDRSHYGAAS